MGTVYGAETNDDTQVNSTNDFNKELSNAGYHDGTNSVFVNVDKIDMTDSTEVIKTLLYEQERHTQSQNEDTQTLDASSQTVLSKARGDRGADVWSDYSDLNGFTTKSDTAQTNWNTTNKNSATVVAGTKKIEPLDSKNIKPYSTNGATAYGTEFNNKILNSQQKVIGTTGKYTLTVHKDKNGKDIGYTAYNPETKTTITMKPEELDAFISNEKNNPAINEQVEKTPNSIHQAVNALNGEYYSEKDSLSFSNIVSQLSNLAQGTEPENVQLNVTTTNSNLYKNNPDSFQKFSDMSSYQSLSPKQQEEYKDVMV